MGTSAPCAAPVQSTPSESHHCLTDISRPPVLCAARHAQYSKPVRPSASPVRVISGREREMARTGHPCATSPLTTRDVVRTFLSEVCVDHELLQFGEFIEGAAVPLGPLRARRRVRA